MSWKFAAKVHIYDQSGFTKLRLMTYRIFRTIR
jgi:hypothetical protein